MADYKTTERRLMDDLLLFFGTGGGKIEGYKKLKAAYFLLQGEYNLHQYKWPWEFWGPDDPYFFYDVEDLIHSGLVYRTLGFAKNEPIHHPHNLSPFGFDYFTSLVDKLRKENPEQLRSFLSHAIAWLRLPSRFSVNQSLLEIEKRRNESSEPIEDLWAIRHPHGFFTSELIQSMERFYELEGFNPKIVEKPDKTYEILVEIPPQSAQRKYHYLVLDKERFDSDIKTLMLDELFEESAIFNFLEKREIVERQEVEKVQRNIYEGFAENLAYMSSLVNKRIKELQALFEITSGNRLSLEIHEDFCKLNLYNDYTDVLKEKHGFEWREHYVFQYWHILQPYELRDALRFFTAEYLHEILKGS